MAFLRSEREYKNVLLVEQPNTDFAYSIARQFLFDEFHLLLLEELQNSHDETLAAIAKKSIKEVRYHVRFSSDWIKRLGDGTEESHAKIQNAINDLWAFTDELFHQTDADKARVINNLALNLVNSKKLSEAEKIISQAFKLAPDKSRIGENLEWITELNKSGK